MNNCKCSFVKNKVVMKVIYLMILSAFILSSCDGDNRASAEEMAVVSSNNPDAQKLVENKCNSCHNPDTPEDSRLAPPFFAIQKKYGMIYSDQEEFEAAIIEFVLDPKEEKVEMKGAFQRFGLMPKMEFSKEDIEAIAKYIYTGTFTHPPMGDGNDLSPMEQGKGYAMTAKSVLGKNLMGQINVHGTDAAIEFCNLKAFSLIDSVAQAQQVNIKRVSDKPRNPINQANDVQLAFISLAKDQLKNGEEIKPKLLESEEGYTGYYPILTNQMCLQCHGQKETQIKSTTLKLLSEKYPADQATGYGENELRGIFVVEWMK